MNRIAGRAFAVLLVVLLLVGGMAFFVAEFAAEAEDWILFPGSPHVYNSGKVGNGYITDREGTPLADMSGERIFSSDETLRKAMLHWLGDREGNISTPALSEYAAQMTGFDLLNGVYAYGDAGYVMELTLSAAVQKAALEALDGYDGTVAVYNYETGEILCAVSAKTFDPDDAPVITDENAQDYDGVYVNRFTQSTYIPGSIFKSITVAAALETIPDIEDRTFVCYGSYEYGADAVTCEGVHYEQNIREAFANSCNCAFAQIAELLGEDVLTRYVRQFRITEPVCFDGITTAEGNFDLTGAEPVEIAWSGIGQYTDQINPCRFLTFMGTVASGGQGVEPHVISSIRVGNDTTYTADAVQTERIMSTATAEVLKEYLRNNVETVYGAWNFPGLTVCAKSGTGEVGDGKRPNAAFAGFVDDPDYPLAFIAVVEDAGYGSTVCVPIISEVLAACKEVMDN